MVIRLIPILLCLSLVAQEPPAAMKEIEGLFNSKSMNKLIPKATSLLESPDISLQNKSRLQLLLGEAYSALNQPQEAIKHLLEVERTDPNSPYRLPAYQKLLQLNKEDKARYQSYLEKIFLNFPKTAEAVAAGKELASLLIESKTYSQALDVLGTLYKLWQVEDPDGILQMQLATAYAGLRDYVEAGDYIQALERLQTDFLVKNPEFIFTSAQVHYSAQRFERAIELLNRLINVYPRFPQVLDAALLLAQSYERKQNPYLGAVTLIQALKFRSEGPPRHDLTLLLGQLLSLLTQEERQQLSRVYPGMTDPENLLMQVYSETPQLELKRRACQLLVHILRQNQLPRKAVDISLDYLTGNRESSAFKLLRESMDEWLKQIADTGDGEALRALWETFQNKKSFLSGSNLSSLSQLLGKHEMFAAAEEVAAHIRKYRMYDAYWPKAEEEQVDILLKTQRLEAADKALADAAERVKEEARFRWFAWQLAVKRNADDSEIGRILSDLPPLDPEDRASWELHLAAIDREVAKKEFTAAKAALQKLEQNPNIPQTLRKDLIRRNALLAFHQGDFELALSQYRELAKSKEEAPWALFRQITILDTLGRKEEARILREQLKESHPDSYWSRQIR